ncbi:hypothetical protein MJO28_010887 [Puccinia striiformis f. sp. tritici]|uniref:Uncharacterized protein n=1 Tax=Puccinia striiformis f. sp. tritici TaxID=168172 RepID=A0ACC0E6C7_9BASI|nr:hypothetical protein Pst134EA_019698 [Puccinia striiformis f. sp. tritici]KAH9459553.1 hypothetical protein Pst134EA_019698 [Puccinia striiformis f. sp. tritici]KAI7945192.1 hypothetical protein MJO28_010887 [Puccinia striiformis f. sp. tritici]
MAAITLRLVLGIYLFRLLNALSSQTFFQPDEYYQSLEVAHRLVFGYGYQSWEWQPTSDGSSGGIRSPLHPFLFVPGYWILRVLGLDHTRLLIIAPKIVQAGIATVTDVATYSLANVLLTPSYSSAALACSLTSLFNAYAGIRTFSNSLETALTASALAYWPWNSVEISNSWADLSISILFIALSVIIRPPSILFWSLLGYTLLKKSNGETRMDIMALVAVIGVISALACLLIDSSFYGLTTFTPLNFVRQNVFNGISAFYGVNRWHFYFTQAFTFVNFSMFPTVILGMMMLSTPQNMHESQGQLSRLRSARVAVLGTMIGLSVLSHKEFRFIQPLMPLFSCFAARAMVNNYIKDRLARPATSSADVNRLERIISARPLGFILRSLITLVAAFYLLNFHYRAQVSVIDYLRQVPDHELVSVGFLMPCHSTPWQSHLHKSHLAPNGSQERLWMLTCEPPLISHQNSSLVGLVDQVNTTEHLNETQSNEEPDGKIETAQPQNVTKLYEDEAAEFYKDPAGFLTERFPATIDRTYPATDKSSIDHKGYQWPSHVVLFEALWNTPSVREILSTLGYSIVWNAHNGKWHDDPSRRAGSVIVLRSN